MSRHKQDTKRQRRIHKKTLEQLYYEEGLTQAEIAAQLGCSKTNVYALFFRPRLSRLFGTYRIVACQEQDNWSIKDP